jgi:hypothetical protein
LILTGDFFQLPPVGKTQYTFEAGCWESVVNVAIVLKKVFRQKDESKFCIMGFFFCGEIDFILFRVCGSS